MRDLTEKALQAKGKKAKIGQDIDLESYGLEAASHDYVEDLDSLSEADKNRMILAGIDTGEKDRSGTYIQKDMQCYTPVQNRKVWKSYLLRMPLNNMPGSRITTGIWSQ